MALSTVETDFLQRQMEIHLMEAHIALVKASRCSEEHSNTDIDIRDALRSVDTALKRKEC